MADDMMIAAVRYGSTRTRIILVSSGGEQKRRGGAGRASDRRAWLATVLYRTRTSTLGVSATLRGRRRGCDCVLQVLSTLRPIISRHCLVLDAAPFAETTQQQDNRYYKRHLPGIAYSLSCLQRSAYTFLAELLDAPSYLTQLRPPF